MTAPSSRRLRILVVDDSMFMRAAIRKLLAADPGLEVVGEAKDGLDAVDKVGALQPDVVTMDINMPRLDGIGAVREILKARATPIVMLSAHTREGARETFEALAAGAVDFLAKPVGEVSAEITRIGPQLVAKVRAASEARPRAGMAPAARTTGAMPIAAPRVSGAMPIAGPRTSGSMPAVAPPPRQSGFVRIPTPPPFAVAGGTGRPSFVAPISERVVVIGISTGGPAALDRLLPALPSSYPHALVVIQHMPAGFTAALAERLASQCKIRVREAQAGDRPERGTALIAPGDFHLEIDDGGAFHLSSASELHGVRPAADVTMRAAARTFGRRCVGVLMTGLGRDGADGLAAIKSAGGVTLAQDRESCVIYGMPRAAVELGVVDQVVPLDRLAEAITRIP